MKKIGNRGFVTIVLLFVVAGLVYYVYLSNRSKDKRDEQTESEIQQLLQYDFENNYPKTARETVKLHCRYMKCAYNQKFTDDELITVNQKIRKLFDEELLQYNTEEAQLKGLKDELEIYKENKQKFVSFSLPEASQIQHNEENGQEYEKMRVALVLKIDTSTVTGDEEYILRKDGEGRWKILGWQAVKNNTNEGEAES